MTGCKPAGRECVVLVLSGWLCACCEQPRGPKMDAFEAALADLDALRADLPAEGDSGVTVLDSKRVNALLFSQGSWSMIARDLLAAK